jgi:hypothetical protein
LSKKRQFFRNFFLNHNIGPRCCTRSATRSSSPEEVFREGGGRRRRSCSPTTTPSTSGLLTAYVPSYRLPSINPFFNILTFISLKYN